MTMTTTADTERDSINVLIVDDDEGVLWTLKELLEVYNFVVDTASSGADALDILGKTDPDCILMDIVMPEQSGVEAFRKIKPLKPATPVVFMTGYAHSDLEDEARREGAVDVIPKPIDMKYLVSLIQDIDSQTH